ncbi:hypothetical protein SRRS_14490 [Sporomusa rhizae]|uniref:GNAT family N-acetyltransferase n=1 Tax=Sporomusa rhizae TaxID=357999 RepID=UPI00352B432F
MIKYSKLTIETNRLVIRPLFSDDYKVWLEGYCGQEPSKSRFDEGWLETKFLTETWFLQELKVRENLSTQDICYMFNIFCSSDGKSIGNCDITTHMRDDFQYARVGYTIHNQYWGNGYATEALKGLIRIGFEQLNFHRLEAHINLDNPASKRVSIKAGMLYECIRKAFILEDGEWTDNEIYFINNQSWSV